MTTENKRMSQLSGNYADLDLSQLLNGELALPTDHNPVFKDGAGNVRELLTAESAGYLEDLIAEMNAGLAEIEQIIIQRIGINDEEVSSLETFSSSKITDLLADKQDTLTAGDNVQISAENVISATDTTYTAGSNIQINANNEISATDTTYTAGTNITIDSNNQIDCNVLDDTAPSSSTTYSSAKIMQVISDVGGVAIDDTTPSTTTVYSSSKTENLINTSLSQLKDLLYPVGCIVQTTAYSTTAQMVAAYGGSDWDLIQEKVLIGANWVDASNPKYRVNATGGSETVTLTTANLPSHNHSYTHCSTSTGSTTITTNQMPNHNHTHTYYNYGSGGGANGLAYNITNTSAVGTDTGGMNGSGGGGSHYHSITRYSATTGDAGSGTSFSIINPYKAVYIWTRTA